MVDSRRDAVERLERAGIPYYVTGSEALALLGLAFRQTQDLDLVIGLEPSAYEDRLRPAFEPAYLVNPLISQPPRWMGSAIDTVRLAKVDFIIRDTGTWPDAAMARRLRIEDPAMGGTWVATPEDVLIAKLEWADGRLDGLQGRDVLRVMATRSLDLAYVRQHAGPLGLSELLDRAARGG